MNSETLSLKAIINELDLLKKEVMLKPLSIFYKKEKHKISKTIKNNYSATKSI